MSRSTRLALIFAGIVAVLLATMGSTVSAATPEVAQASLFTTLEAMATAAGVGAVIAFLFERFAWFQALTGEGRNVVIIGLCVGLPLVARLLIEFVPASVWDVAEPYWQTVAAGFLVWASSQAAHKLQSTAARLKGLGSAP
jgi:hypothetical protein